MGNLVEFTNPSTGNKGVEDEPVVIKDTNIKSSGGVEIPSDFLSIDAPIYTPTNKVDEYGIGYVPSQYDDYEGLRQYKANSQDSWDKFKNVLGRGAVGFGISTVEMLGHVGDVEHWAGDAYKTANGIDIVHDEYSNWFNDKLLEIQQNVNEALPIYTHSDKPDIGSADWWWANGDQMIKSIGYFIPGMAVTKGASLLLKSIGVLGKANAIISPIAGASIQNYSEHMMSATQAYNQNRPRYYKSLIEQGYKPEEADKESKRLASEDAAEIVQKGKFNIFFESMEYMNLFKGARFAQSAKELGAKAMLKEIGQTSFSEGMQEMVTGHLESEAQRHADLYTGKIEDDASTEAQRLFRHMGTYKGMTEGILGALGGAGMQVISGIGNIKANQQAKQQAATTQTQIQALRSDNNSKLEDRFKLYHDAASAGVFNNVYSELESMQNTNAEDAKKLGFVNDYASKAEQYIKEAKGFENDFNKLNLKFQDNPHVANNLLINKYYERHHRFENNKLYNDYKEIKKEYADELNNPMFKIKETSQNYEALYYELQQAENVLKNDKGLTNDENSRSIETGETKNELESRIAKLNKDITLTADELNNLSTKYVESRNSKKLAQEQLDDYLGNITEIDKKITDNIKERLYHKSLADNFARNYNNITKNRNTIKQAEQEFTKQQKELAKEELNKFKTKIANAKTVEEVNNIAGNKNYTQVYRNVINERIAEINKENNIEEPKNANREKVQKAVNKVANKAAKIVDKAIKKVEKKGKVKADTNKNTTKIDVKKESKQTSKTASLNHIGSYIPNYKSTSDIDNLRKLYTKEHSDKLADAENDAQFISINKKYNDIENRLIEIHRLSNAVDMFNILINTANSDANRLNNFLTNDDSAIAKYRDVFAESVNKNNVNDLIKFITDKINDKNLLEQTIKYLKDSANKVEAEKEVVDTTINAEPKQSDNSITEDGYVSNVNVKSGIETISDNDIDTQIYNSVSYSVDDNGFVERGYDGTVVYINNKIVNGARSIAYLSKTYSRLETIKNKKGELVKVIRYYTDSNIKNKKLSSIIETPQVNENSKIRLSIDKDYRLEDNDGLLVEDYESLEQQYKNDEEDWIKNIPVKVEVFADGNWHFSHYLHKTDWIQHDEIIEGNKFTITGVVEGFMMNGEYIDNITPQLEQSVKDRKAIYNNLKDGGYFEGIITNKTWGHPSRLVATDKEGNIKFAKSKNKFGEPIERPLYTRARLDKAMPYITKGANFLIVNGDRFLSNPKTEADIKFKGKVENIPNGTVWVKVNTPTGDVTALPLHIPVISDLNSFKGADNNVYGTIQNILDLYFSDADIPKIGKSNVLSRNNINTLFNILNNYLYFPKQAKLTSNVLNGYQFSINKENNSLTILDNEAQRSYTIRYNNKTNEVEYSSVNAAGTVYEVNRNTFFDSKVGIIPNALKGSRFSTKLSKINTSGRFKDYIVTRDSNGEFKIRTKTYDNYNEFLGSKLYSQFNGTQLDYNGNPIYFDQPNIGIDFNYNKIDSKTTTKQADTKIVKEDEELGFENLDELGDFPEFSIAVESQINDNIDEEYRNKIASKLLIKGFNDEEQQSIVSSVTALLYDDIINKYAKVNGKLDTTKIPRTEAELKKYLNNTSVAEHFNNTKKKLKLRQVLYKSAIDYINNKDAKFKLNKTNFTDYVKDFNTKHKTSFPVNIIYNNFNKSGLIKNGVIDNVILNNVLNDYDTILEDDNWNIIVENSKALLDSFGFNIKNKFNISDNYEIENASEIDDHINENERWNEDTKFTIDPKIRASARFKLMLALTPNIIVENGIKKYSTNRLGLTETVNVNTTFNNLRSLLANKGNTLEDLKKALGEEVIKNPSYNFILKRLNSNDNKDYSFITEFVNIFSKGRRELSKQLYKSKTVENNGRIVKVGTTYVNLSNNNRGIFKVMLDEFREFQKTTPLIKSGDNYTIDLEQAKKIEVGYHKLYKQYDDHSDINFIKGLQATLSLLGFNFSINTLTAYSKSKYYESNLVTYKNGNRVNTSLMGSIFASFDNVKNTADKTIADNNPLYNKVVEAKLDNLLRTEFDELGKIASSASLNSKGQLIQEISDYNYITYNFNNITDEKYIETKTKTNFGKHSIWKLELASKHKGKLEYKVFDSTSSFNGKNIVTPENMTNKANYITRITSFQNNGNEEYGWYFSPTLSDSKNLYIYKLPKTKVKVMIANNKVFNISDDTLDILFQSSKNEIDRVAFLHNNKQNLTEYKSYVEGGQKFYLNRFLNQDEVNQAVNDGIITESEAKTLWVEDRFIPNDNNEDSYRDTVLKLIKHNVLNEIQNSIDSFTKEGVLTFDDKTNEYSTKLFDYDYMQKVDKTIPNKNKPLYAIADYVINHRLAMMEQHIYLYGDPAIYSKYDVDNTAKNMQKRFKGLISPHEQGRFIRNNINIATINDLVRDSDFIKSLEDKGIYGFRNITVTDAAEYTTAREAVEFKLAYNYITKEQYDKAMSIIDNADENGYYEFEGELKDVLFQIDKPILFTSQYNKEYDFNNIIFRKSGAIGLFPQLTKGFEIDKLRVAMETQNIDRVGYSTADKLGSKTIDEVWKDGKIVDNITLTPTTINRTNMGLQQRMPTGKNKVSIMTQMNALMFNNIRDKVILKENGKDITGRELEARKENIRNELFKLAKKKLIKELNILEDNNNYSFKDLSIIRDRIIEEAIKRNWSKVDIQQLTLTDDNEFEFPLLYNNSYKRIQGLLLNMITDEIINIKLHGKGYIQTTGAGFNDTTVLNWNDLTDEQRAAYVNSKDTVFTTNWTGKLKAYNVENDKVQRSQVFVSWNIRNNKGELLDINDFKTDGVIDFSKLPKEVLEGIAARIPTQGHSSMLPIEIVGFLPAKFADTIIVTDDIVAQMGSDFDIDKLYSYLNQYYQDEDGKVHILDNNAIKYLNKLNDEFDKVDEEYRKLLETTDLANIRTEIRELNRNEDEANTISTKTRLNEIYEKYGEDNIKHFKEIEDRYDILYKITTELEEIINESNLLKQEYVNINNAVLSSPAVFENVKSILDKNDLEDEYYKIADIKNLDVSSWKYQADSYLSQTGGKSLIAITSLYNIFNSYIQDLDINYTLEPITFKFNDIVLSLNKLGGNAMSNYNGELRTISDNIMILQNGAVDNANKPYLGALNINQDTIGVAVTLAMMNDGRNSLSLDYITRFLNQPIILDFIEELKRNTILYPQLDYKTIVEITTENISKEYNPTKEFIPSNESMLEVIKDNSKANDNNQMAILHRYLKLLEISQIINKSMNASLYSIRKGAGKTIFDTYTVKNNLNTIKENKILEGLDKLYQRDGRLTELGGAITEALYFSDNLMNSLFKTNTKYFNSVISTIQKVSNSDEISSNEVEFIMDEHRRAVLSGSSTLFNSNNLNEERASLIYDTETNKSLGTRIEDYLKDNSNKWLKNNFEIRRGENTNDAVLVLHNNNTNSKNISDINNITSLTNLLVSNNEIERAIGEDLIKYSYLMGGIFTPNSFVRFANVEYLKHIGFSKALRNIEFNNSNIFIRQYYQHNPNKAASVDSVLARFNIDFNNQNNKLQDNTTSFKIKTTDYTPRYISNYTNTKWKLFEIVGVDSDGNRVYVQIDTLGDGKFTSEYNLNNANQLSYYDKNKALDSKGNRISIPDNIIQVINKDVYSNNQIDYNLRSDNSIINKYFKTTNFNDTLENIDSNPAYKHIATLIYNYNINNDVNTRVIIDNSLSNNIEGSYQNGLISINDNTFVSPKYRKYNVERVLLHEGTHSVTTNLLKGYHKTNTEQQDLIIDSMLRTFNYAKQTLLKDSKIKAILNRLETRKKDNSGKLNPDDRKYYGLTSIQDFLSEAMSNREFQELLNNIKYNKDKSVLQKFTDQIVELLKTIVNNLGISLTVKENSVLEATLEDIILLLNDDELVELKGDNTNIYNDSQKEVELDLSITDNQYNLFDEEYNKSIKQVKTTINEDRNTVKPQHILDDLRTRKIISMKKKGEYYVRKRETTISGLTTNNIETINSNYLHNFNNKYFYGLPVVEQFTVTNKETRVKSNRVFINEAALEDYNEIISSLDNEQFNSISNINNSVEVEIPKSIQRLLINLEDRRRQLLYKITNSNNELLGSSKEDILNWSKIADALKANIDKIKTDATIETIGVIADRQLTYVDKMLKADKLDPIDFRNLANILDVWNAKNVLDYLTDEQKNDKEHPVTKMFMNIANNTVVLENRLNSKLIDLTLKTIKEQTGIVINSSDLENMNPIGLMTAGFLDPSKTGNPLMQTMDIILKNAANKSTQLMRQEFKAIDKLGDLAKEYGITDFTIFYDKDNKGEPTSNLVDQFSWKWNEFSRKQQYTWNKLYDESGGKFNKEQRAIAAKLKAEYKKNTITLDLVALGKMQGKRTLAGYTFKSYKEYKAYLDKNLGEHMADYYIEEANKKHNQYLEDLKIIEDNIKNDDTIEDKEAALNNWILYHSPKTYLDYLFGNLDDKIEISKLQGKKYLAVAPRKIDAIGKETGFYSKDFETIRNNPNLWNFYVNYKNFMNRYLDALPTFLTSKLDNNFLPKIQQNVLLDFNGDINLALQQMSKAMIDSITTNKTSTLIPREESLHSTRDINTGEITNTIPLPLLFTKDNGNISTDLINNLKLFAGMSINFAYKNKAEDIVLPLNRILQLSKELEKTPNNENIKDKLGDLVSKVNGMLGANAMMQGEIDTILYNKSKAPEVTLKKKMYSKGKVAIDNNGEVIELSKKKRAKQIQDRADIIQERLDTEELDEGVRNDLEFELKELEVEYESLGGRAISVTKIMDKLMTWTQLKGLGLNFTAGISNVIFGLVSNATHANGRTDFNLKQLMKAVNIVLKSRFNGNKANDKVYNIAMNFNYLFDAIDTHFDNYDPIETTGKNKGKVLRFLKKHELTPYMFQTKGEYLVQSMSFIAHLMNTKVDAKYTKNNVETNYYDILNNDGTLNTDILNEEGVKEFTMNLEVNSNNSFDKARNKGIQINKLLHGNYDPNSRILAKRWVIGRMFLQFRSWLPEGIASRFQSEYYDSMLGRKLKGRYITYGDLGFLDSMKVLFKQITYQNNAFILNGKQMNEVDIENMRRNLAELASLMTLYGVALMLKLAIDDDDDNSTKNGAMRVLFNALYRGQQDIYMYVSPTQLYSILHQPIPVSKVGTDAIRLLDSFEKEIFKGDSYKGNTFDKLLYQFPYLNQVPKVKYLAKNELDK